MWALQIFIIIIIIIKHAKTECKYIIATPVVHSAFTLIIEKTVNWKAYTYIITVTVIIWRQWRN